MNFKLRNKQTGLNLNHLIKLPLQLSVASFK